MRKLNYADKVRRDYLESNTKDLYVNLGDKTAMPNIDD